MLRFFCVSCWPAWFTLSCVDSRIESMRSLWPLRDSSVPTPSRVEMVTPLMSAQVW